MLEPGAGSGNIIKTLQKYGDFSIDAVEIRPEEAQHLQDLGVNVIIDDFLSMDLPLLMRHSRQQAPKNSSQHLPASLWT